MDDLLATLPPSEQYDLPIPETARGKQTRTRILAAAEAVFGEQGYERASIAAITQAASVAQGSFYTYFPSKHAVFVELIKDFAVRVRHALSAASRAEPPTADRGEIERRGLEAFFAFALAHPGLYNVVREAQFVAPPTYRWYYESFVSAYVASFEQLSAGYPEDLDIEMLGWVMAGISDILGLRWVVWDKRLPPPELMDELATLLLSGFDGLRQREKR
jgi:AcrR family transcriptional regulator